MLLKATKSNLTHGASGCLQVTQHLVQQVGDHVIHAEIRSILETQQVQFTQVRRWAEANPLGTTERLRQGWNLVQAKHIQNHLIKLVYTLWEQILSSPVTSLTFSLFSSLFTCQRESWVASLERFAGWVGEGAGTIQIQILIKNRRPAPRIFLGSLCSSLTSDSSIQQE